jgi:hypothetical protein
MTLYDFANATTIQGNVEVRVYADNSTADDPHVYQFQDCEDFAYSGLRHGNKTTDDMTITYLFSRMYGTKAWTIIEVEVEAND